MNQASGIPLSRSDKEAELPKPILPVSHFKTPSPVDAEPSPGGVIQPSPPTSTGRSRPIQTRLSCSVSQASARSETGREEGGVGGTGSDGGYNEGLKGSEASVAAGAVALRPEMGALLKDVFHLHNDALSGL